MSPASLPTVTALAACVALATAQSCPKIHVFGARETTTPQGYGSAGAFIDMITAAYPGTTSEAIVYPACGGGSSCGGIAYGDSANEGTAAVASAVNSFYQQCPTTQLILVGYSQGGQIMDNAFCGGGDSGASISSTAIPISSGALAQIKAAIFFGDPRYEYGFSYEVGSCRAGGVSNSFTQRTNLILSPKPADTLRTPFSLMLAPPTLSAPMPAESSLTATL